MEDFYDPALGSVESHIDHSAFTLVDLDLPGWFINGDFKAIFASRSKWDSVVSNGPLQACSRMASVLSSVKPPGLDFFQDLPKLDGSKEWGVYTLLLEHPQLQPILYVGSGTDSEGGVQLRHSRYRSGTGPFAAIVKRALAKGYTFTFGVLCWTKVPPPQQAPRLRARFLVLEAVFTIIFCACVKTIMDEVFIPDFFLWDREEVAWLPGCTHLSLNEGVRADLKLTPEELIHAAELRRQRSAAKTQRYRKRKREEDEEAFLQNNLQQHRAWSERNPGRVNEIAAGVRNKAKDLQRFRCEVCDHNAATQYALDEHNRSQAHRDAERRGHKVLKPLSASAENKRASRAAIIANQTHFCRPCNKACTSVTDLKRHTDSKKHKATVARQQSDQET